MAPPPLHPKEPVPHDVQCSRRKRGRGAGSGYQQRGCWPAPWSRDGEEVGQPRDGSLRRPALSSPLPPSPVPPGGQRTSGHPASLARFHQASCVTSLVMLLPKGRGAGGPGRSSFLSPHPPEDLQPVQGLERWGCLPEKPDLWSCSLKLCKYQIK